jgi:UDP-N-acetyl-2-amino-2-deoxyglucuronate dehydrogenase
LRVALVGCGKIGQKHLQALVHRRLFELVATVDADLDKASAAAVAFDAAPYDALDAALRDFPDLDAVIVATPSGTHRMLVETAFRSNKHVLVERPMALTAADARDLVEMAEERHRVLAVTQFNRLLPSVALALETYRQGRLGRLVQGGVAVRLSRLQSYYDAAPWRGTRSMDGGILFNQAIHAMDVLLQFSGPIVEAFAYGAILTHQIETEDTMVGVLRAESGALLTVEATTSVADGNLEERVVIIGDQGSLVLGPTIQQVQFWRVPGDDEDEIREEINQAPARAGWHSHADALEDFARAVGERETPKLSGRSALHAIEVIEALLRSAECGIPVALGQPAREHQA